MHSLLVGEAMRAAEFPDDFVFGRDLERASLARLVDEGVPVWQARDVAAYGGIERFVFALAVGPHEVLREGVDL